MSKLQWFKLANTICWTMLIITDVLLVFWAIHDIVNNRMTSPIFMGLCIIAMALFNVLCWFALKKINDNCEGEEDENSSDVR